MSITELERLVRVHRIEPEREPYEPKHEQPKQETRWRKVLRQAEKVARAGGRGVSGLRAATAPALATLSDHWMSIAAAGAFDWAAFLWNDKSGLITAGIMLILLELKVSD